MRARPGTAPILRVLEPLPRGRKVADALRETLIEGVVAPGSLLPCDEISRALGVSHIPVREALSLLQAEGLVDHRPHYGFAVHEVSAAEYLELQTVRGALEMAALPAAVAGASEADIEALGERVEAEREALAQGDGRRWDQESRALHALLIAPAAMPRLTETVRAASNVIGLGQPMQWVPLADMRALHTEHEQMVAAFTSGDIATLVDIARTHMDHVRELQSAALNEQAGHEQSSADGT